MPPTKKQNACRGKSITGLTTNGHYGTHSTLDYLWETSVDNEDSWDGLVFHLDDGTNIEMLITNNSRCCESWEFNINKISLDTCQKDFFEKTGLSAISDTHVIYDVKMNCKRENSSGKDMICFDIAMIKKDYYNDHKSDSDNDSDSASVNDSVNDGENDSINDSDNDSNKNDDKKLFEIDLIVNHNGYYPHDFYVSWEGYKEKF